MDSKTMDNKGMRSLHFVAAVYLGVSLLYQGHPELAGGEQDYDADADNDEDNEDDFNDFCQTQDLNTFPIVQKHIFLLLNF